MHARAGHAPALVSALRRTDCVFVGWMRLLLLDMLGLRCWGRVLCAGRAQTWIRHAMGHGPLMAADRMLGMLGARGRQVRAAQLLTCRDLLHHHLTACMPSSLCAPMTLKMVQ